MDQQTPRREPAESEPPGSLAKRAGKTFHAHREFVLVLVLFLSLRLMAILAFRPGGYLGEMGDFGYYRLLLSFTNQGLYPVVDFWMEYPPLFPWIALGLYRLSLLIPPWPAAGTWFFLWLGLILVLADAGVLILLYRLARRLLTPARAVRLAWIYTALLIPLLTLFVGFDTLALFFLLWAILLTLDRRPIAGAIAAGLGFMTKLVPIVAAPAALMHLPRLGQRARYLLALALTLLIIALPFLLTGPDYFLQSLISPVKRSTWESPWALIDGYYSYGIAGGPDRFDPAQSAAAQHPTRLPWTWITVGFILFYFYLWTRRVDWRDARRVVAFAALTQNLLTLYFKGYSPQFLVMLLPFLLLLLPAWRAVLYALLLSAVNLVEYPIYFLVLPDQPWLLAGTVLLRTLILIVVSVEYAGIVYSWRVPERWWRRVAAAVTAVVLLTGIAGLVPAARAYHAARYAASPHRSAMETILSTASPGAALVVDDQGTFEAVYPFLYRRLDMHSVEIASHLPPWEPRLAQAAAESGDEIWIYAPAASPFHTWAAGRYTPLDRYEFDGRLLTGWRIR
ncbi:MAG: DUF2029 domain-containing protein [Anaerolineae bacterium]|nr:DUF2029 domain-containing protein [Anaerolineae bacterium]